jgi:hypothetical protein
MSLAKQVAELEKDVNDLMAENKMFTEWIVDMSGLGRKPWPGWKTAMKRVEWRLKKGDVG